MSSSIQATKSVLIMVIFSLGTKFLGFIREILIAAKFGSGMETDTFFVATTAIGLITSLVGTGLSTSMIPVLAEIEDKEGKNSKIRHTNNIFNLVLVISILLLVLGWITAPFLIKVIAKGFSGEQYDLAVTFLRIGLPAILFSGIVSIFRGYLQSELMFTESAATNFPFNLVYIFFLLFLSTRFGIKGLMVTSVLAVLSQFTMQIPGLVKTGFKYKHTIDIKNKYVIKILKLTGPVFIGVAINDLNVMIDRTLASGLVSGSISALNYANKLNSLILGIFITAITTVIFPMLAKESNRGSYNSMKIVMGHGINTILLITIPSTIGLIVLAKPIVEIAFERGAFDLTATIMTSQALLFYSIGLVSMSLQRLLAKVYYSLQDTKTPMISSAISLALNIILNIILMKYMAHAGLALATSIANSVAALLLLYWLRKKIGLLGTKGYIATFAKSGLASVVMGIVVYLVYNGLYGFLGVSKLYNLISLLAAVGIGVLVYGVLCYVFGIDEVRNVVGKVRGRLLKR